MLLVRLVTPAGNPADRSIVRWVIDGALVLAAFATTLPDLFRNHANPPAWAIPVLIIVVAPLIVRRRFPMPVFGWVAVGSGVAALFDDHVVGGLAVLIGLYTVAETSSRRDALLAAGALEAGVLVGAIVLSGSGWWYDSIFLSGLVAAAVGLGLYTATRRADLAELHDRTARLERERDQQGALAAAAERARISREMHDIVAHHLTVMVALSDGAIAATATSAERGVDAMRTVSATGRQALIDTRRLLGVLRETSAGEPQESLQPVPDLTNLDDLLERVRAAGLRITFELHGSVSQLPAGVQLTVYRLVQEALTNTLKHAGPDAVASVRLRRLPGELRVEVDDDGAGAQAPALVGVGGGLRGMQERVLAYGGEVSAGPRATGGWRVSARLCLDEADVT
jgi:signal transduction histidine kinase